MLLEQAFPEYLLSVPEITAIVRDQIYGIVRPQGLRPLPEILVSRSQTSAIETFCGVASLKSSEFQVDCYGAGLAEAATLADALRKALKNFSGTMGDIVVQKVFLTNQFSAYDPDPGTIRVTQTYNFWFLED